MRLSLEKASPKLEIRLEQDTNHLDMNAVRVFIWEDMFVLKLDSLTHSLVHSSSHLVFLQHLIFVRFMAFSKKYLTNRETFTLCRSKKEGEDEMRREGFFHVNK